MPKATIILPTYNCARYLQESIESVLSQTFRDYELVIVDDGSTDQSESVIQSFSRYPQIRYLKERHQGLSSARNKGISASDSEYIAFLDADDIFLAHKLERQVDVLDHKRLIDIVYTSERYFNTGDKIRTLSSPYAKLSGDLLLFLKRSNFIHISTVMVRRRTLDDIQFDPSLKSHEDWDLFLKLSAKRCKFYCIPDDLSLIRVRLDSMTLSQDAMDSSRKIVGGRARSIWKELKKRSTIKTKEGILCLSRYAILKTRAFLLYFPNDARFNRLPPIAEMTKNDT